MSWHICLFVASAARVAKATVLAGGVFYRCRSRVYVPRSMSRDGLLLRGGLTKQQLMENSVGGS